MSLFLLHLVRSEYISIERVYRNCLIKMIISYDLPLSVPRGCYTTKHLHVLEKKFKNKGFI